MITEETVAHVAKLARLALTPEETQRYTADLGNILTLVDALSELDLGDDQALSEGDPTVFRSDDHVNESQREPLLANAPLEENGFFRVPKILDES